VNYIIYNKIGKILRTINCSPAMSKIQAKEGEFILEGEANDVTQKIEFDGFDEKGQPINPRIVNKTLEEIEKDNPAPPEIPFEKRLAGITNGQLNEILGRLAALEVKQLG